VDGATLAYKAQRATRYAITNNAEASEKPIVVYVDHQASMQHNGYSIVTSEDRVKEAAGFARFEKTLAPGETVVFEVHEEATYEEAWSMRNIRSLLTQPAARKLFFGATISEDIRTRLLTRLAQLNMEQFLKQLKQFSGLDRRTFAK